MNHGCYRCGESKPVGDLGLFEGVGDAGCKAIVICGPCMDAYDFDMWTDEAEWNSIRPAVAYAALPKLLDHEDNDPTHYPTVAQLLAGR